MAEGLNISAFKCMFHAPFLTSALRTVLTTSIAAKSSHQIIKTAHEDVHAYTILPYAESGVNGSGAC